MNISCEYSGHVTEIMWKKTQSQCGKTQYVVVIFIWGWHCNVYNQQNGPTLYNIVKILGYHEEIKGYDEIYNHPYGAYELRNNYKPLIPFKRCSISFFCNFL